MDLAVLHGVSVSRLSGAAFRNHCCVKGPTTDDLKTLCLTSLRTVIQTFAMVKQSTVTVRYYFTAFVLLFRPHRSITYVDAACCYRRSSVVCLSVCLSVMIMSLAKITELVEMPFRLWTLVGQGTMC